MLDNEEWLNVAQKFWNFSYVNESKIFPDVISGSPYLLFQEWRAWDGMSLSNFFY